MHKVILFTCSIVLAIFGVCVAQQPTAQQEPTNPPQGSVNREAAKVEEPAKPDPAVDRTRRQVEMLDGIYKGGIVLITENYVDGDEDLPAGTAFKKLFESAKKNGWHEVKLLDATGDPYNDENVAVTDFEKQAIKQLVAGKPFVEKTITENDKRYFLAATPIPVVMEKCTMCHSGYDVDEKGLVIGALTYRVPIDE